MKDPKVDELIQSADQWSGEMSYLRQILLDCLLIEAYKWRIPVYMFGSKNILGIASLKDHVALNFFKGGLLQDAAGLLIKPGENTQSGRWMKFGSLAEIQEKEDMIRAYVFEAIEVEKLGLKAEKAKELPWPAELAQKLSENEELKSAFCALTPGRQRAYVMHFSEGKQAETRLARIEKNEKYILRGKGLTDCVCGLTKKKPGCDGSHKSIENFKR